jgi:septal ring factor EnvC (AmiA/AmiB activator)
MTALSAILFALAMTVVIGGSLFAIGGNALLNKNTVPLTNAPGVTNVSAADVSTPDQQQLAQLQQLVGQSQSREQQYQTELNQAVERLNQANQQLTQANTQLNQDNQAINSYQQLLSQLVNAGVITISSDGHVYLGGNR